MSKSWVKRIILIAASVLILIGVSLMTWMLVTEDDRNNIEVRLSDGETEKLKFESLSLVPGEQCEYNIILKSDNAKKYDLSLDFVETEEKTLKDFARVKILSGSEVVYDELLKTAFEDESIVLPVDFTKEKNSELNIVYYLPIEVGNEAKNAEAKFELMLTASNE